VRSAVGARFGYRGDVVARPIAKTRLREAPIAQSAMRNNSPIHIA
jgi:hypothetical protein